MVEVIWKTITSIISTCRRMSVSLHDALHELWQVRGMGTVTLDSNLDQYLSGIYHEPLLQVLLDVNNA